MGRTVARVLVAAAAIVIVAIAAVAARRRRPHLPADPRSRRTASHPVAIINPHSGSGKAEKYGIVDAAQRLGIATVTAHGHHHLVKAAHAAVDDGSDHLLVGGGDGSLAAVASVAMERDIPLSVIPIGTRNHFAMDLGLDGNNPIGALDAAFDGYEVAVDVGRIASGPS